MHVSMFNIYTLFYIALESTSISMTEIDARDNENVREWRELECNGNRFVKNKGSVREESLLKKEWLKYASISVHLYSISCTKRRCNFLVECFYAKFLRIRRDFFATFAINHDSLLTKLSWPIFFSSFFDKDIFQLKLHHMIVCVHRKTREQTSFVYFYIKSQNSTVYRYCSCIVYT